ncbi:MAG TPA: hypothetical protein VGS60_01530 [Actinomycetes bacterium]|nr:hypothetical protein [Actinomycetes bacterium]
MKGSRRWAGPVTWRFGRLVMVMLIDCEACSVRDVACGDCAVGVLLGMPPAGGTLDAEERTAIGVLAASGLVPPLRLTVERPPPDAHGQEQPRASSA